MCRWDVNRIGLVWSFDTLAVFRKEKVSSDSGLPHKGDTFALLHTKKDRDHEIDS
jgi:hypothetical protein